mgnify:CR=1 FL=1|tara:strand:+ start:253 stop:483 length:231 start_codon:yes stop_codon:yes gene_type:complete
MQKIVNTIAILSGVGVLAIVGAGGYLYLNKDALIEKAKEQILEQVTGGLGGMIGDSVPDFTGPALSPGTSLPDSPL